MKESITVLVPAYNEEKNLEAAVKTTNKIVKSMFKDYEIIIFDDGSKDRTGEIADALAKRDSKIRVIHNKKNMGLGYNYKQGIKLAQKNYFVMIPGDNEILADSVKSVLSHTGKADIIIPFTANKKARPLYRRVISSTFTNMLNLLFGLRLKYYLGIVIHKTELVKKIKIKSPRHAYQAEILIKLIKSRHSYKEVPMYIRGVKRSKTFGLKNITRALTTITKLNMVGALTTIIRLFFEINFKKVRIG